MEAQAQPMESVNLAALRVTNLRRTLNEVPSSRRSDTGQLADLVSDAIGQRLLARPKADRARIRARV